MIDQSPELREAHEAAQAIHDGLKAAAVLRRHARIAQRDLAQLRDSGHANAETARVINRKLRREAFATANALKKFQPTPAQPLEAQHGSTIRNQAA